MKLHDVPRSRSRSLPSPQRRAHAHLPHMPTTPSIASSIAPSPSPSPVAPGTSGPLALPPRRDAKTRVPSIGLEAFATLLGTMPALAARSDDVRYVEITSERRLASPEHVLVGAEVTFKDGAQKLYVVPVVVGPQGRLTDGMTSSAFKGELLDAVARGETFELAKPNARREPRRRPTVPRGFVGAQLTKARTRSEKRIGLAGDPHVDAASLARAIYDREPDNPFSPLVEKGYTTRERYEYVVEQAQKLSPKNADALVVEFFKQVLRTRESHPESVRAFHAALATRPKFGPVFYGYAQFIGVPEGKSEATFDDLTKALDVIQGKRAAAGALTSMVRAPDSEGLGFSDVELLPFFLSPKKDGGYDITEHAEVDPALGGNPAFERFMKEAVERGICVTADLVANHVSNEHPWVKALLAGDESMLSRFVVWDDAVKIGERKVDDKIFNVFLHTQGKNAGKISHVWQIFPDNNPDTFIKAEVGDKTHNIYASFMNPYQWDVNAADPAVLGYYLKALGRFANLGQMGTRMDAIIHMGKKPGTFNINLPESQAFMALAKAFAAHVAPGNTFLPEANLPWKEAREGWLDPQRSFDGVVENTAGDCIISFDVHRAIRDSLLKKDKGAWMRAQAALGELPPNKSLLVYLGLHDETLIEDPKLRESLVARGFHDFAGRGVGDSPAALLDGDANRLAMAHVLLYSSKGHPAVYYRTIVGPPNNSAYYESKMQERLDAQYQAGEAPDVAKARDTRDLDRGPVTRADYDRALATGYKPAITIRALNALRKDNAAVRTNHVTEVKNPDAGVVSVARCPTTGTDKPLLQVINLKGEATTVTFQAADLKEQLGWAKLDAGAVDLLQSQMTGKQCRIALDVDGEDVKVELPAYGAMYLQLREE